MRTRWIRTGAVSLATASVLACGDGGPDPQDLVDVLLDFCASETPAFLAYQNEGRDWVRVTPDAEGTFSLNVTEKFVLAIVHQDGAEHSTEFVFATPADVQALSGVACNEQFGAKTVHGSVSGVPLGSAAMVSMGGSFAHVTAPSASFSLTELPNIPLDVVAHREVVGTSTVVPDRAIIRRAENRTHGSTMPVLDFQSNEAQNITPHTFTASGLSGSDDTFYLLSFHTSTTRGHSLSTFASVSSGAQTIYGIPATLTQTGDLHELEVFADAGNSYRGEVQFYRQPGNRTIALGPVLSNPTITTAASSPHLRFRLQLTSQVDYGSFVSAFYAQQDRFVAVTATSSYFGGTPVVWDLTIPDMSGVSGFPANAALQSGAGTSWFVDAYGGSGGPIAFFGRPSDGAILRFAGRSSSTNAMMLSRTGSERSSPHAWRRTLRGL
jgi:hypothetical protein